MTKSKLILTSLLAVGLLWSFTTQAQLSSIDSSMYQEIYKPTTGIRGAFLGSVIYPGFNIGVERPYKYTQKDKVKENETKTIYRERYFSYSIGMYHQSNYHTNFLLQTQWIARRQKSKGFYYETSMGVGLSRTFVDGATYMVSDNGQVEEVPLSGNWYALASVGGSLGYNANLQDQKPYSIYVKHQWLLLFPYNAFVTPRPTIELGINYNVTGFWEATPKYKYKEKQSKALKKAQN